MLKEKKDVIIRINTETSEVISSSAVAGVKSENLQGNLIIIPEPFIDGTGRFFIDEHGSIEMTKQQDCYVIPILSSLLANGDFDYCFKITEPQSEQGIPVFVSEISSLKVPDTIESNEEIPEQYPTWIEIYDSKIAEINALEDTLEQAEQSRNQRTNKAINNIVDMTEAYNKNATKKTDEFNKNATSKTDDFNGDARIKKQELEDIADGVRNMATAIQLPQFYVDERMRAHGVFATKLSNVDLYIKHGKLMEGVTEIE